MDLSVGKDSGGPKLTGWLAAVIIIPALTFIVYSDTFSYPFLFDDDLYIVRNPGIRSLGNIWPPAGTRFFGYLTFAINYSMGGLNTFWYHLTNYLIHVLNSLLVYILARLLFKTPAMQRSSIPSKGDISAPFALFVSTLFALHPVQTEGVTYITQRFASLAFLFYVTSAVLFLSWGGGGGGLGSRLS